MLSRRPRPSAQRGLVPGPLVVRSDVRSSNQAKLSVLKGATGPALYGRPPSSLVLLLLLPLSSQPCPCPQTFQIKVFTLPFVVVFSRN